MADSALELQKAIIDSLLGDTSITNEVSTRIYGYVPRNEEWPYIRVSLMETVDAYSDESPAEEVTMAVEVISSGEGGLIPGTISRLVRDRLGEGDSLALTGFNLVYLYFTSSDLDVDGENQIVTRSLVYRALTEEN